jgi:menaquinone-dependent protoporphyrinogen IX oxidase
MKKEKKKSQLKGRKAINSPSKTLIILYSFEESTKLIAETIAEELKNRKMGADLLELRTKDQPSSHGFMKYFWGGRMAMMKKTPELETLAYAVDFDKYSTLIIGTPVWAWTFTPPLRTFFRDYGYRIKNKKIALFACHEGGLGKTLEEMEKELVSEESKNIVIAKMDFEKVAKNKIENIKKAQRWAVQLIK